MSRSNPFSAVQVLKEHSKILRKAIYGVDENWKERMPNKNVDDDLQKEITYCKALEKTIESDQTISLISTVKKN